MTTHHKPVVVTALAAAALLGAPQLAQGKQTPSPPPPPAADESGCRDLTGGVAKYQRLLGSITQDPFLAGSGPIPDSGTAIGAYQAYSTTLLPKGVASATVTLAAPSCPGVTYTVTAYDAVAGENGYRVLAQHSQVGDGISGSQENPLRLEVVVPDYARNTVALRVTTTEPGVTHDTGPDDQALPAEATAAADGLPGGGAVSSFK